MTTKKKKVVEENPTVQQKKEIQVKDLNLLTKMYLATNRIKQQKKDIKDVDIGRYKATSHNLITNIVAPILHELGLFYVPIVKSTMQNGNRTEATVSLQFYNVHNPQESMVIGDYVGYGVDNSDKGPGKAYSYAIKFILMKTFKIESNDGEGDESELSNPEAKTVLTDQEKADKSLDAMYKEVKPIISTQSFEEAKQYWENYQNNKGVALEFNKLNSSSRYINFINSINKMIQEKKSDTK